MRFNTSVKETVHYRALLTSFHQGDTHDNGHFTCCVKQNGQWFRFHNDGSFSAVSGWASICPPSNICRVFYERIATSAGAPTTSPTRVPMVATTVATTTASTPPPTAALTAVPPAAPTSAITATPTNVLTNAPPASPPADILNTTQSISRASSVNTLDLLNMCQQSSGVWRASHTSIATPTPPQPRLDRFSEGTGLLHAPPPARHTTRLTDDEVAARLEAFSLKKGDRVSIWMSIDGTPPVMAKYIVKRCKSQKSTAEHPEKFRLHVEGGRAEVDEFFPQQADDRYVTHIDRAGPQAPRRASSSV